MTNQIFICHSSLDNNFVVQLAQRLKNDGMTVWIDDWMLEVGDSIIEKINKGLEDSSFFMIVISNNSINSKWVKKELNSTLMRQMSKNDIKILPILLDFKPENLPPLLSDMYAARFSNNIINEEEYFKLIKPIKESKTAQILHQFQDTFLENIQHIDLVLNTPNPTLSEVKFILMIIQEENYSNYFFKKVESIKFFDILKNGDFFSGQKAPRALPADKKGYWTIPQWNVLPYLEKVSMQVNQNEEYINELLKIIMDVTEYHTKHNKCLDNYRTWWYFAKILCNLPTEKITNEIIDLIPIWLDSNFDNTLPASEIVEKLLPKFLDTDKPDDWEKAEKIVDKVTEIKWVSKYSEQQKKEIKEKYKHIFDKPENQRTDEEKLKIASLDLDAQEPKTIVDLYYIELFVNKKIALKLGEKCSEKIIFNLANKLNNIFEKKKLDNKNDLSYIWIRSLFNISYIDESDEIIALILREILSGKAKKDINNTKLIIEKFLNNYKYPLFKRLVLYICAIEWEKYKGIFWDMVDKDENGDLFNDPHYEAEVYTILEKNVSKFTEEEKVKIKKIIEGKVPREPHPEEKYREYYSKYQKQKWYSAVKSDDYFKPLYEKCRNSTKKEEEISFKESKVRVGPGSSPLSKESILKMSNEELAKYLITFKTVDYWKGPTIGGLSDVLKATAQETPEKFIADLKPFLKTGYLYIYDILWGIRDVWEKKKPIDWKKLFNFIQEYIKPKDFWDDKYKIQGDEWEANHLWVLGIVGELIKQGTIDDAWAFPEEYFQIAQEILFKAITGMIKKKEKIYSKGLPKEDFITYTYNSSFGKITEALFMLALRIKRTEEKLQKKQPVSWEINIKGKYNDLLNNEIIESYVLFGKYLPNFYYLDKEWTESKIQAITVKGQFWEAFMEGYFWSGIVKNELYEPMKNHCKEAINYQFKNERLVKMIVQYISIYYLREIENLEDSNSLFRQILDKWKPSQIKEIINFFWRLRSNQKTLEDEDDETKKIREKIIIFWKWMYENKYKEKQEVDNEDKNILSELCKLTVFLPEINDENSKWLEKSAPFSNFNFHASFFIEYLDKLKDKRKSIEYIGKIFLEILENATPDYKQENIRSIVEFLYKNGKKQEADKICNIYVSRGYEFLRDLWESKNNKNI